MKIRFYQGKYVDNEWKIGAAVKVNSYLFKNTLRPDKSGTMVEYAGKISTTAQLPAGSHLILERGGYLSAVSVEPAAVGLSRVNQYLLKEVAIV